MMSCPTCKGYGMVTLLPAGVDENKITNWSAFTRPCPDCNQAGRERAAWLRTLCRVPSRYLDANLSSFQTIQPGPLPGLLGSRLKDLTGTHWVTLWGVPGVGKTLLLCASVNEAVAAGRVGVYVTVPDLLDHLRKAYNPASQIDGDRFWDTLVRADVLALDEIDRFNPTAWAREKFFELVNHRYNEPGLTLFATNRPVTPGAPLMADAPGYFESRLAQGLVIEVKGIDRRPYLREAA